MTCEPYDPFGSMAQPRELPAQPTETARFLLRASRFYHASVLLRLYLRAGLLVHTAQAPKQDTVETVRAEFAAHVCTIPSSDTCELVREALRFARRLYVAKAQPPTAEQWVMLARPMIEVVAPQEHEIRYTATAPLDSVTTFMLDRPTLEWDNTCPVPGVPSIVTLHIMVALGAAMAFHSGVVTSVEALDEELKLTQRTFYKALDRNPDAAHDEMLYTNQAGIFAK